MAYDIVEDHAEIKKQIKKWELEIDKLLNDTPNIPMELRGELEGISEEMMSINL